MTPTEYWTERAKVEDAQRERLFSETAKDLGAYWKAANEDMQSTVEDFALKYLQGDPEDAYAVLQQKLKPFEMRQLRETMSKLSNKSSSEAKRYARIVQATKSITRIEALTDQLAQYANVASEKTIDRLSQSLYQACDTQFSLSTGKIKAVGAGLNLTANSPSQIRALVDSRWLGSSFSERVWKNRDNVVSSLRSELTKLFTAGADSSKISQLIAQKNGVSRAAADRLVRTEGARVATMADQDLYDRAGLDSYEYLATLDTRTSDICAAMNGKRFKLKDMKVGLNAPPLHPNCRSTTTPDVDVSDIDQSEIDDAELAVAKKYGGIALPRENPDAPVRVITEKDIQKRIQKRKADEKRH